GHTYARAPQMLVACLLHAACGQPPRAAPVVTPIPTLHDRQRSAPPAPPAGGDGRKLDPSGRSMKGWSWGNGQELMFVDGGAALVANGTGLLLIDPRQPAVIDVLYLRSASVPDRGGTRVQGAKREQDLSSIQWSWNATRHTLVGVGCRSGWGDVVYGLSVWWPGLPAAPTPLTGAGKPGDCRPLAISADGS